MVYGNSSNELIKIQTCHAQIIVMQKHITQSVHRFKDVKVCLLGVKMFAQPLSLLQKLLCVLVSRPVSDQSVKSRPSLLGNEAPLCECLPLSRRHHEVVCLEK